VLALGLVGLVLSGTSWAVLQFHPKAVEFAAFDYMKGKVAEEASLRLHQDVPESKLVAGMQSLQRLYQAKAEEYDEGLRTAAHEKVAEVIARMCASRGEHENTKARFSKVVRAAWMREGSLQPPLQLGDLPLTRIHLRFGAPLLGLQPGLGFLTSRRQV
jgi:hypothetical protein